MSLNIPLAGRQVGAARVVGERAVQIRAKRVASLVSGNEIRRANEAARSAAVDRHRQQIESRVRIQTFSLSIQQRAIRVRGRCPYLHCGGTMFNPDLPPMDLDRPHPSYVGRLLCALCGRVVAKLEIGTRMTAAELAALPSRQGKPKPKPRRFPACADCGEATGRLNAVRCRPCNQQYRAELGNVARLIVLLGDGRSVRRTDLALQMGVSMDVFRKLLCRARAKGRPIVSSGWGYVKLKVQR